MLGQSRIDMVMPKLTRKIDEDDPDAGIEVDVYEGSSIKRKVGVLKKDANSIAHLLTHRYRNIRYPFCE